MNGIQTTKKRLKLIEYFKSNLNSEGFLFLQETHSTLKDEVNWTQEFKGQLFFSHGKSSSCGVLICYFGSKNLKIRNKIADKDGRILILEIELDDQSFTLINLYNPNTESEQLEVLEKLENMLSTSNPTQVSQIIFAGDFYFFFNSKLESDGGNPVYKNRSVAKLIELKEKYTLTDIRRIRNPYVKRYTFRQNHFSGFIQRRLDYIFISNSNQEYIDATDILPALSTDHSPNPISFCLENSEEKSAGFWKSNNSLLLEENFTSYLELFIKETKIKLNSEEILDPQVK